MNDEPVTHSECEEYRRCTEERFTKFLQDEKDRREKDFERVERWIGRLENRLEGVKMGLLAVAVELLIGLILAGVTLIGGRL